MMMKIVKSLFCAFALTSSSSSSSTVSYVEKLFVQGPHKQYLLNSSTLFLPTDYLSMNIPIYDARTVVINSGTIGGLDSLVPDGVVSRAFKDTNDGDFFYQIWHFAHIDDKHHRTNVVSIIVSLGDIDISPSGDIEDTNRQLLSSTDSIVYVQVYRTWSVPSTIPLTQVNIDGWWHSITHAFHTAVHIWNEVKPWIGIARTVIPILVSLDDTQSGLGLKSLTYSPDEQSTTTNTNTDTDTGSDKAFTYALTPGEMSAVVIFVFLSGAIVTYVIPKVCGKKEHSTNTYKLNAGDFETRQNTPLV